MGLASALFGFPVVRPAVIGAMVAALLVGPAPAGAAEPAAIRLYPDAAPAAAGEQVETRDGARTLRNVTDPTLTPFLPAPGAGSGAVVIIAPGGAFMMLSYDSEGTLVARWLAAHGVAAFVLKYRLEPTPRAPAAFMPALMRRLTEVRQTPPGAGVPPLPSEALADADAVAAIRLVRAQANELHIDPHKVGFLGFSAGAIVATTVSTGPDPADQPDFTGVLYGALRGAVPADAPPAFFATAADDPLLAAQAVPMFEAWKAAHRPAELHLYERGGHGFGLTPKGSSSDHWLDEFFWWMQGRGLVPAGSRP
jgi:acetyl esterase/lipase